MKKTTVLILGLILLTGSTTYSQLGKVKMKRPSSKSVKDLGKKKTKDKTESATNGGKPEYDPNDPVYQAYSRVRDGLKFANSSMNSSDWSNQRGHENEGVVKDLLKAKTNLDILKDSGEDKKEYYKDFLANYKELEAKRVTDMEIFKIDKEFDKKLDKYYNWAKGFGVPDKDFDASYTGYKQFVKKFESERADKFKRDYVQKRVLFINDYLANGVYEEITPLQEETNSIIKSMHTKNKKGEEYYMMNAPNYIKKFEDLLKSIKYLDTYMFEKKDKIKELESKIIKEKSILDNYVSSGDYEKHVAEHKKEKLDAVRIGKKAMSNSKYEQMAIKGVDKGAVGYKAVITSSSWKVIKTDWGYPLEKTLPIEMIVKKDGKCYLAFGQMKKKYEGGGVYGKEYFDYWGIQDEMNCSNIDR